MRQCSSTKKAYSACRRQEKDNKTSVYLEIFVKILALKTGFLNFKCVFENCSKNRLFGNIFKCFHVHFLKCYKKQLKMLSIL